MNGLKPCFGCGNINITAKIMVSGTPSIPDTWFVKCDNCQSVCTTTNAVEADARKEWNNLWGWNEVDRLKTEIKTLRFVESAQLNNLTEDQRVLKLRFEKLLDEYIKYRMLYSGTAGNLNLEDRRKLMTKEILSELGWN